MACPRGEKKGSRGLGQPRTAPHSSSITKRGRGGPPTADGAGTQASLSGKQGTATPRKDVMQPRGPLGMRHLVGGSTQGKCLGQFNIHQSSKARTSGCTGDGTWLPPQQDVLKMGR